MPKHEQLNRIAQRQMESIGQANGLKYVADRMEILNMAAKWLEDERDIEGPDLLDILATAEFLAGDRVEST